MKDIEAERDKYKQGLKDIYQLLGYGIKGCPTDGEYHAKTYAEAFKIAEKLLGLRQPADRSKSLLHNRPVVIKSRRR